MPVPNPRPRPILIAVAVGVLEALALLAYGVSIVLYEQRGETTGISGSGANLAPVALIGLLVIFAALVLLVTWMLDRGRRAARTPYVMVQAFALVVAQPLVAAGSTRVIGVLVVAALALGCAALFTPDAREHLR